MGEKDRIAGFRALMESRKSNSISFEELDGRLLPWDVLSAEAKLDVPDKSPDRHNWLFFMILRRFSLDEPSRMFYHKPLINKEL